MDEYIVELEGVCKTFPGVRALDNVSFSLKAGEAITEANVGTGVKVVDAAALAQ